MTAAQQIILNCDTFVTPPVQLVNVPNLTPCQPSSHAELNLWLKMLKILEIRFVKLSRGKKNHAFIGIGTPEVLNESCLCSSSLGISIAGIKKFFFKNYIQIKRNY